MEKWIARKDISYFNLVVTPYNFSFWISFELPFILTYNLLFTICDAINYVKYDVISWYFQKVINKRSI